MQTIRIANVERKSGTNSRGDWTQTTVTGEDNTRASTFQPNELKAGDVIEAEIEVKGKYANIKSFRKVTNPIQTPLQSSRTQKEAPQIPNKSNTSAQPVSGAEKGMIIKEIGDNFRAGLFTQGTQPDIWEYYRSELSRVTGVRVN